MAAPDSANVQSQAVIKHAFRYLPTRVVPVLLGIAVTPVLTRTLEPDGYARYTLLVLLASYASVVFGEWIAAGYQRFVLSADVKEREAADQAFSWTTLVLLLGTLLATPLVAIGFFGVLDFLAVVVLAWALTLFQFLATRLVMAERSGAATFVLIVASTGRSVVAVIVALAASAATAVLSTGCWLLLLSIVALGAHKHLTRHLRLEALRLLSSFGGFMLLVSLSLNGMSTLDRFLLAWLTTVEEVGRYSASYLLSEQAVLALPSVLVLAVVPRVTALWESGQSSEAGSLATFVAVLHLELAVPVIVLFAMYSATITHFVFGAGFENATVPPLVASGATLFALSNYANLGLRMRKRAARQALQSLTAFLLNIILVIALVPQLGPSGAAVATLIAYFVVAVWALADNRWFIDITPLLRSSLPIVLPAAGLYGIHLLEPGALALFLAVTVYIVTVVIRAVGKARLLYHHSN